MQVYRGMDIGTAKPTVVERRGIPHHMIDLVEPDQEFSVAEFRGIGRDAMRASEARHLLITGGSGLHFRALVDPMSFAPTSRELRAELEAESLETLVAELSAADPAAVEHVDLSNRRRVVRAIEVMRLTGETPSIRAASAEADQLRRYVSEIEFTAVGIDPGSELESRVKQRTLAMRSGGLVEEVRSLRGTLGRTASLAVGYREILEALASGGDIDAAFGLTVRNTVKLARKQRTWFQRDPRIRWIPWMPEVEDRVEKVIEAVS